VTVVYSEKEYEKDVPRIQLGILGTFAEPSGTDGRPVIRKKTSVTGRHYGPALDIKAGVYFLIGVAR